MRWQLWVRRYHYIVMVGAPNFCVENVYALPAVYGYLSLSIVFSVLFFSIFIYSNDSKWSFHYIWKAHIDVPFLFILHWMDGWMDLLLFFSTLGIFLVLLMMLTSLCFVKSRFKLTMSRFKKKIFCFRICNQKEEYKSAVAATATPTKVKKYRQTRVERKKQLSPPMPYVPQWNSHSIGCFFL